MSTAPAQSFGVFSETMARGHEEVAFFTEPRQGFKAIVAVHSTVLGPGLGGIRLAAYPNDDAALLDVLRLSEGMTYKSSLAGLPLGGGKSCIIAPGNSAYRQPTSPERAALFEWFGRCVERVGGRYIAAEDMGTSVSDVQIVRRFTKHTTGNAPEEGGSGDPSPWTALGVFNSILALCSFDERLGSLIPGFSAQAADNWSGSLAGLHVLVQGVGHVGHELVKLLVMAGAKVSVADTSAQRVSDLVRQLGVTAVGADQVYTTPCDIYAPCAVGQTVNPLSVGQLQVKAIAGAANNQISEVGVHQLLQQRGIVYLPDFAVNSGGVIACCSELVDDQDKQLWISKKVAAIYDTTRRILETARVSGKNTEQVALELAKDRVAKAL